MNATVAKIRHLFGNTGPACAMDAEWREEAHTRGGHTGNPGQFSKGSGGGGAKTTATKPAPKKDVSAQAHAAVKAKLAEIKAKPKKPAKPKKTPAKAESSATPAKPKADQTEGGKQEAAMRASFSTINSVAKSVPQKLEDAKSYSPDWRHLLQTVRNMEASPHLGAVGMESIRKAARGIKPVGAGEPNAAERNALLAALKKPKAEPKPKKTDAETQERADLIAELRDLGHKPKKTDTTATMKQMLAGGPAPKEPTAKPKAKASPKEPSATKAAPAEAKPTTALSTAESSHIDAIKGADRNKAVLNLEKDKSIKAAGMAKIAEALLGRKLKSTEKTRSGAIMAIGAWRPTGAQKAEAKSPAPKSLKEFGASVQKIASSLPDAKMISGSSSRGNVAISDAYEAYKKENRNATLSDFKKELLRAAKAKEIDLKELMSHHTLTNQR